MTITIQQAVAAHQQGKFEEAERLYREILKVDSNHLDANNNLGALLYKLDRLEEAEKSYKKAIMLKPDFAEAHYNLAMTLQKLERLEEAELSYRKVIELKPDYVDIYKNLGNTLKLLGKLDEAEIFFKKMMKIDYQKAKDFCDKTLKKEINEYPEKAAFVYREVKERGFFLENDLEQIKNKEKILPILTWSFLDFIQTLDLKDITLHELGSGNSTIWFSNIFKFVESYETNENWYNALRPRLNSNISLKLTSLKDIYDCSIKFRSQDWLLIDFAGKRTKFIQKLCEFSDDLIPAQIILDNSNWYQNGVKMLIDRGYTEIPFYGFTNSSISICCTSLFLLKNTFKIKNLSGFYYPKFSKIIKNTWDTTD